MSLRVRLAFAVLFASSALFAAEISSDDAARAARAWVDRGYAMGKFSAGRTVAGVDEVTDPDTGAQLRIVRFAGGGFVVLSADDLVDPVIAFSEKGTGLDIDDDNPFWSLLRSDIAAREAASGVERGKSAAPKKGAGTVLKLSGQTATQRKWAELLSDGTSGSGGQGTHVLKAAAGLSSLSDIRVDSFVQSRWSQSGHANTPIGVPCYNYYTTNHYVCGCVATAQAQLMRYWQYPTANEPVEPFYNLCYVDNKYFFPSIMGGTYDWDKMPLEPMWVADITEEECQAIGKLTYDIGVTVGMSWKSGGSSASVPSNVASLMHNFHYASAHAVSYSSGSCKLDLFKKAVIPNFDARCPCLLSIQGSGGHAVLADGYGYSDGNFFIHVNMGWSGSGDAWYNPPNIEEYTSIRAYVYNVFPRKTGSIASGRVLDQAGNPVADANVALSDGQTTVSDANGIYAFIAPAGTYDLTATKSGFTALGSVTLGETAGINVSTNLGTYGAYSDGTGKNGNVYDNNLQFADMPSTSAPVFSPGACAVHPATNVAITCADSTATIHYTVDGTAPDETSPVYVGPIYVNDTVTIKARSFAPGCNASAVAVASYTYDPGDGPQKGDNFDDPIEIYGASGTRVVANNELYTIEEGEPVHVVIDGVPKAQFRSVWYRWTAPASGRVTFRTYCRNGSNAFYTNIAAYQGDTLANARKLAFSTNYDANYAHLLPLDVVQGDTYRLVGMISSTNTAVAFGTFTLRWDDEFPTGGGDPTPVLGSCTATVDGTNVAFSVSVRRIEVPAAVSVFYGPDENHLAELSLGTANVSGTLAGTALGLDNGSYVWFARAVSTVDGTPHAAESTHGTFTVNWIPPPEGMLIADGFAAGDYTVGATLKSSTGGDTTGFTSARKWSAKTATGVLYVNNDGLSFPDSWSSARYPSGGYAAGFKSSGTESDTRGACRQLADGAFPTSGTIYYRILLRHQTGASHCPEDCYRAAGFLPNDFASLGDEYAQYKGKTLFDKGLWLGTRGKGNGASSINLRLGSQDLVLVDTMQEGVTYLCVAKMEINADGLKETATGFAVPVNDYKSPAWSQTVLSEDVVGTDAPLEWFGIVGGYKTNNKYVSFDELAVSTILADVVPVSESTTLSLSVFRPAEQGGGMLFAGSGADRSLTFYLEDTLSSAYYAVFTNGTLQGPFFAAAKGVKGAGLLELPVDAKEPSKFFAIGVSDKPISVGDWLVPGANAGN